MPTRKQHDEIDGLATFGTDANGPFTPTNDEITDFIAVTTHGKRTTLPNNRPLQAKRLLTISIAMWQTDCKDGQFTPEELLTDPTLDHPFLHRTIKRAFTLTP